MAITLSTALLLCLSAGATARGTVRTVVVLYPVNADEGPGTVLVSGSIRATFTGGSSEPIHIRNEYLDFSPFQEPDQRRLLADFLRKKYARQKIDLVIAGLAPSLDFALQYRDEIFPRVPIVFMGVDQDVLETRKLPADVIGVPVKMDLAGTLEVALRLNPTTRRVFVITGASAFDRHWEARARRTFRRYEDRVEFVYLSGLTMDDLLTRVSGLPDRSIIQYLHVFEDGAGKTFIPAQALELVAAVANAPIYGHLDSYLGHGIVGGRVFSVELEGRQAAHLGLRILGGQRPEQIDRQDVSPHVPTLTIFDWRQLRRWGISETSLPPGSEIRFRNPSVWDLYRWHIVGAIFLFVVETALIVALLAQMARRRRSDDELRRSQNELRTLTGRLLQARETESRRIARELHDDLGQGLALLTVELDLLRHKPPAGASQLTGRLQALLARVKHLSSSVHNLSRQLHPSKLEQLGLVAAISGLCRELAESHGLKIEFTHDQVPATLSADVAVCLYRVAQEALSNAIKHGGAQQVEVDLSATAESVLLRIVDHGRGFDPRHIPGAGLGLVSMRERVLHLGGGITIDSQPSRGTRIHIRVPIREITPA
jgi:signal transduction histidine kinase